MALEMKHLHRGVGAAAVFALAFTGLSQWEGMDLTARHQRIDPPLVVTACIGETNMDDKTLTVGQRFTVDQCKERLKRDLPKYIKQVDRCLIDKVELGAHRYASLIMFVYNLGGGAFCHSKVSYWLNHGDPQQACDAMLPYNRANGKYLQGLANRRKFEREWCLRED